MRRPALLLTVLGAFGPVLHAQSPIQFAEDLYPDLASLIERAGTGAAELRLGQLRVEERAGDLQAVRAQQRPQVRLNAQVTGSYETRDDIDNEFRGNLNANLALRQPLYQWGNLDRTEAIAEHRVALEELGLQASGARQFMELRRAYLQWLLTRERRDILRQSIGLSESFVTARRQLLEVGQSSEQEVLEMEARLLENREALAWAERQIIELESRLERFVGPDFDLQSLEAASLTRIQPMTPGELDSLKAMLASPESVYAVEEERWEILETIEDRQMDILDKSNWPMIDFVAGIFSDQLDAVNQDTTVTRIRYYAGVSVNWHIFDSWQTDGQKRSTLARKRAYALRREEALTDIEREVELLLSQLEFHMKQLEARGKREDLIDRRVSLLREQAERNLITGVELIEGEIDFLEVRQRVMESRVNYLLNLMELGLLLEKDPAAVYYASPS